MRQGCLEPSSWSFQDVDVSHRCQLSNLPPSCNVGRGYPSQRQTNEGTKEVRSPARADSSWQQEELAVADWLMLLAELGMLCSHYCGQGQLWQWGESKGSFVSIDTVLWKLNKDFELRKKTDQRWSSSCRFSLLQQCAVHRKRSQQGHDFMSVLCPPL